MQVLFMVLLSAFIVAADQLTKIWVVANIPLHTSLPAIDGLFHLTYVQNTGAAFSALEGMQWLFALVFAIFTAGLIWEFSKKRLSFLPFERWCVLAIWAGGLGNMLDRVRLGYVVDMIAVDFIEFPVFNVADCFITCGCIALMVSLIFFNREMWKEDKK